MPSYTTSLRLLQPSTGEYPGSWGSEINTRMTSLVDAAVAGTTTVTMTAANVTLTNADGVADQAKSMFLVLQGSPGGSYQVIVPSASKLYFVTNSTGFAQTVKTASGSGISVPNGARMTLRCDGTDVVVAQNYFASMTLGAALPTASGGTGLTSFTANGVVYASSSSALATGSGLVFDGTNLGLGVTPSAWGSAERAIEVGLRGNVSSLSDGTFQLAANSYVNSSGQFVYRNTAFASRFEQVSGQFRFFTAPSGTAGNAISFTQAMTLDASGNLGIQDAKQYLWGSGRTAIQGTSASDTMQFFTASLERSRITQDGRSLLGTTGTYSANAARQSIYYIGAGTEYGITLNAGSVTTNATALSFLVNGDTSGGGGTAVGSVTCSGSATAYNTSSDYRLKDNSQPLTNSGAFIDALQPKTWNWKVDGSKGVGFIAHEAQAVSPSSVTGTKDAVDADGKPVMQAMEYGSAEFIANIIAELKSLRARVAALEQA